MRNQILALAILFSASCSFAGEFSCRLTIEGETKVASEETGGSRVSFGAYKCAGDVHEDMYVTVRLNSDIFTSDDTWDMGQYEATARLPMTSFKGEPLQDIVCTCGFNL